MLLMLTQARAFKVQWELAPDKLLLISIGAGQYRPGLAACESLPPTSGGLAWRALIDAVNDTQTQTLALLQWFSEPALSWPINSEIGDLRGEYLGGRPLLSFQRYDMKLEAVWLQDQLDLRLAPSALNRLRRVDDPATLAELHAMGTSVAERQVQAEHLLV
jgi:hypothetical protein